MSYFDFFSKNIVQNEPIDNEAIQGKCETMCPQEEIELRVKNTLVHTLEVVESTRKMIKSYSRSAADSKMAIPHMLRPYPVLKETVHYLLLEVTERSDVPLNIVYDFVNDRLRAVRQDMTIQRLPPNECVTLLEPMIRFYVHFGYRLCEYPIKDYDPVLNKKYLLECLKLYLSSSDALDSSQQDIVKLSEYVNNLDIKINNNNGKKLQNDRNLMEALYILCNIDDVHPLLRYLQLPRNLQRVKCIQTAYRIGVSNLKGNFLKVVRLSKQLCPLTYYAFCLDLPVLQKKSLQVISHAYNSKQLFIPCQVIREWLMFNSDTDALGTCKHYGLKLQADKVYFGKSDFKTEAPLLQPKQVLVKKEKLDLSSENIFTYNSETF